MLEDVAAVDTDDGDVPAVPPSEVGVGLDVDLFEGVGVGAVGRGDGELGLFAEVAARPCVEDDVWLGGHGPNRLVWEGGPFLK